MSHEWKSHLLITRCYKSAKNTASNVEDNDASFLLISPDTSVWSRQRAFYPVISLSDVCTAKKLQDHFLSFFSASLFGFAPNSLKQFELCKKKKQPFAILSILPAPTWLCTYSYHFWISDHWGQESKCCVALFPPHSSLQSLERILLLYKCFLSLHTGSKRANLRMLWFMFPIAWNKHRDSTQTQAISNEAEEMLLARTAAALPLLSLIIKVSQPLFVL